MSNGANHNCQTGEAAVSAAESLGDASVRHFYVHYPFCAGICPSWSFYKDLLDRSQMSRFCEAILRELGNSVGASCGGVRPTQCTNTTIRPSTIYFGGGTPTALNIAQLESL